ncbi:MAG: hypothetical protein WA755_00280 [Candidatus Acidiferrales bacterium]
MCNCFSQFDLIQFSEFRNAGIPLDEEVVRDATAAGRGLSVYQVGRSQITDLELGGTGYLLGIGIRNESNRILSPCAYRLELPWDDEQFGWLEPSSLRKQAGKIYGWQGEGPGYPANVVLNHCVGARSRLFPGDCLEGWLLGTGQATIPGAYRDRERVKAGLTVFDGRANRYAMDVKFAVHRKALVKRQHTKGSEPRLRDLFREMHKNELDQLLKVS